MNFLSVLHKYSKTVGIYLMFILPAVIIGFLIKLNFKVDYTSPYFWATIAVWSYLVFNALLLSINAILLSSNFLKIIERKTEEGFPVESLEGFPEVRASFKAINMSGIIIALSSFLSLAIFLLGALSEFSVEDTRTLIQVIAIGLILVTIGVVLIIQVPKEPAFKPGGLIGFYLPSRIPTKLDNIVSDATKAFLDPATKLKYDEWTNMIKENLNEKFEPNEKLATRVERAREKILLLFYLKMRIPSIFTDEVIKKELCEVIKPEQYENFIRGGKSEISQSVIIKILANLQKYAPEIFKLVDGLIIELKDNLEEFVAKDIYVKISVPTTLKGRKTFQLLVFVLNNSPAFRDKKRVIEIQMRADRNKFFPYYETIPIELDESKELIMEEMLSEKEGDLPFYSGSEKDILSLLSEILQIGDAYWIKIKPISYGESLLTVNILEHEAAITGVSQAIKINRDLIYYIKNYGSKLSFLSGLAAPVAKYLQNILK